MNSLTTIRTSVLLVVSRHYVGCVSASETAIVTASTPTPAQARVIRAAVDLFSRHGVGGTSLQMIADEVGVTKAAVYHQYQTKDQIIVAAAEAELARLDAVITTAEAEASPKRARDALLAGIIDLAIERRRTVGTLLNDPVIAAFFADHASFRAVMHRVQHLLIGDEHGAKAGIRTVMLLAAISGAVVHPFVVDLDDDVLRAELARLARRVLGA
jgi:AcrR family transcriptional regulator